MADMTLRALLLGEDRSMSKAFTNAGKSAEKGAGKIKGHIGSLTKAAEGDFSGLTSSLVGGISKIGPWGAVAGAALGAVTAGAGALAKDSIDAFKNVAGETLKMQRIMGGSAEDASRLRFAFHETGVDADAGAKALGIFSKNLVAMGPKTKTVTEHVQVATGAWRKQTEIVKNAAGDFVKLEKMVPVTKMVALSKSVQVANPTLAKLGIVARDAHGHIRPMADLLPEIADKFKAMPNGAEKSALALKLFGKGGLQLLPFLNKGKEGIAKLKEESDKFGLTLSGKDLDSLKKSRAAHKEWDAAMEGAKVRIGAQLLPMVTKLVVYFQTRMIPIIVAAGAWVQKHGAQIQRTASQIGGFIVTMVKAWMTWERIVFTVIGAVAKTFQWLWTNALRPTITFILNGFAMVATAIGHVLLALGHIPHFGWAKTAGEMMLGAAKQARGLAQAINTIPRNVTVNTYYKTHGSPPSASGKGGNVGDPPHRAGGGFVRAGMPYIVGEREPELFVPGTSGMILNGRQMGRAMAGGGVQRVEHILVVRDQNGREILRELLAYKRQTGQPLGIV